MTYIEFSVSAGHGTLVEHGVFPFFCDDKGDPLWMALNEGVIATVAPITHERYNEFISLHNGSRAV